MNNLFLQLLKIILLIFLLLSLLALLSVVTVIIKFRAERQAQTVPLFVPSAPSCSYRSPIS